MPHDRVRLPQWAVLRIAHRDGYRCHICGQPALRGEPWEADHVLPHAAGGPAAMSNLRLAHRTCNRGKDAERVLSGRAA